MFDLIFSNPRIENRFRSILPADKEIGGWFIASSEPETWPGKYSRRAMQRVLGDANPLFINNIILIPNESDRPESQWKPWDFEKVKAIAKLNSSRYGWPIHFHSHPAGSSPNPSAADYAFAGAYLQQYIGYSLFCIITPLPLRLWLYSLEFGGVGVPKDGKLQTGRFFSWRQAAVKGLVK